MEIRTLRADEIECRVSRYIGESVVLLLYKDARCDMRILDEIFTPFGWKRSHEVINNNLFCNVSIWDDEKKEWITKQDVGTESNTEKEKGEASDSFKRACFNVGIGRELYTAPFIMVKLNSNEKDQKGQIKTKFMVEHISYTPNKEINSVVIVDSKGNIRYTFNPPEEYIKKQKEQQAKNAKKAESDNPNKTGDNKQIMTITDVIKAMPANTDVKLIEVLKLVDKAKSESDLKEIWEMNRPFHINGTFVNCMNHKKRILSAC